MCYCYHGGTKTKKRACMFLPLDRDCGRRVFTVVCRVVTSFLNCSFTNLVCPTRVMVWALGTRRSTRHVTRQTALVCNFNRKETVESCCGMAGPNDDDTSFMGDHNLYPVRTRLSRRILHGCNLPHFPCTLTCPCPIFVGLDLRAHAAKHMVVRCSRLTMHERFLKHII
jgi:hypothetical protein